MTMKLSQFVRGALGGGLVAVFYQCLVTYGVSMRAAFTLCLVLTTSLIAGDQAYRRWHRSNRPPPSS
jgi:hypothetical protein